MDIVTIKAGLLQPVIQALGSFGGQKPVALAVRLSRAMAAVGEYHEQWASEHLRPAIENFTGGDTAVPDDDLPRFIEEHKGLFEMDIPVELKPIPLDELLVDGLTVDEGSIGLLLHAGVVVD